MGSCLLPLSVSVPPLFQLTFPRFSYSRAIKTVDPALASGDLWRLWVQMAHYYEENEELDSARQIFRSGTEGKFRYVNDLATIWCSWAEMEIRHGQYEQGMCVLLPFLFLAQPSKSGTTNLEWVLQFLFISLPPIKSPRL